MKVHNTLGNGFQEVIYQRCLAIEFTKAGLNFGRELEQIIYYEGIDVGTRRADFVVENKIIVELKAVINLESDRRSGCAFGTSKKLCSCL